jgi:hypothetical protein
LSFVNRRGKRRGISHPTSLGGCQPNVVRKARFIIRKSYLVTLHTFRELQCRGMTCYAGTGHPCTGMYTDPRVTVALIKDQTQSVVMFGYTSKSRFGVDRFSYRLLEVRVVIKMRVHKLTDVEDWQLARRLLPGFLESDYGNIRNGPQFVWTKGLEHKQLLH